MMNKLQSFLYTNEMSNKAKETSFKYFKLDFSITLTFAIFETFLVLYVLQFVSFIELGIILSVRFAIQALLDYPTGALADILGHKKVLLIAYVGHIFSISIFLLSNTFEGLLIAYLISAIAMSQESGALISWYDIRYTAHSDEVDPDKKVYGAFLGRTQTIRILTLSISFISGGIIADRYSREILFYIHLILLIGTLILMYIILDNDNTNKEGFSYSNYKSQLLSGFSFIKQQPGLLFLFIGIAISSSVVWAIWGSLMLFPTYESYSGSDRITGLLRSSIFIIGVFWSLLAAYVSKRIDRVYRTAFIINLLGGPIFFYLMWMYQKFNPPTGNFDLYSILGLIFIFQFVGIPMALGDILFRRIMIDLIPDHLRNTIYSLLPSIITLFAVPFSILGGWMIVNRGFVFAIFFVASATFIGSIVMGIGYYTLSNVNRTELIVDKQPIASVAF